MFLYLVRHSETEANLLSNVYGCSESAYTEEGRRQFDKIVAYFKSVILNVIHTSVLSRAYLLADRVTAQRQGINLIINPGFIERNFGELEGKSTIELKQLGIDLTNISANYCPPNGESQNRFNLRVGRSLLEIVDELITTDKKVAIFSHSGVIQTILDALRIGYRVVDLGSISLMEITPEFINPIMINYTRHLRECGMRANVCQPCSK